MTTTPRLPLAATLATALLVLSPSAFGQTTPPAADPHHPAGATAAAPAAAAPGGTGAPGSMMSLEAMQQMMTQMMQRMMPQGSSSEAASPQGMMPGGAMPQGMMSQGMAGGGMRPGGGTMAAHDGMMPMRGGMPGSGDAAACPGMAGDGSGRHARMAMMHGGMGTGLGPTLLYGRAAGAAEPVSVERTTAIVEGMLAWHGNPRLKLGPVKATEYGEIVAEVVTTEGSLVQRLAVGAGTGAIRPVR